MKVSNAIEIGLNAAVVAMSGSDPAILRVPGEDAHFADALPSGPFDPRRHRTIEIGLRGFVEEQTGLRLGHVEQLYTFGDRGRHQPRGESGPHVVSVGYLALTRLRSEETGTLSPAHASFRNWYDFLPWEDWRGGQPAMLNEAIRPAIAAWSERPDLPFPQRGIGPQMRARIAFGLDGSAWDEELVLDRYELMYSAGLVDESIRDGRFGRRQIEVATGRPMDHDHRRILATAMQRLRAKMKYRPVIFELLASEFTLTELQQTVESISGRPTHKQNFRRLVENAQLVEPTGATTTATGGRPAALFRFRHEVLAERQAAGLRLGRRG